MADLKQQRLKALISELEGIRGRHTELVTVYVPAGFNLNKVAEQIKQEQSTAQNIKSKAVRKNVMSALEKITQHLKLYRETPANGLAIFCGNVSEKEGVSDLEIWAVEPPEPVKIRMYRCDQAFVLDPLKEIVREREIYGLIVIDKSDAEIGLLKGKKVSSLKHLDSLVPGKTAKGGWCVHEDDMIETPEGRIEIRKIKENGKLLTYDFKNSEIKEAICGKVGKRKSNKAYEIITKSCRVKVTPEHHFFISLSGETKPAEKLKPGDTLLFANGKVEKEKIIEKRTIKSDGDFYDLCVPKFGNFIANGLILHNSQARYARVREGLLHDFMKKVGEIASKEFKDMRDLKGVVVGGPGPVKDEFIKGEFLEYEVRNKVLGVLDTSYTGPEGLEELLNRSQELLAEASVTREKKLLNRFFEQLKKDSGLAVYGFHETMEALGKGAVDIILLSEAFDWVKAGLECPNCKFKTEKTLRRDQLDEQRCPECDARMEIREEKDMSEEILKLSEQMGTATEVISVDTMEGEQLKELGGIAGILRYRTE